MKLTHGGCRVIQAAHATGYDPPFSFEVGPHSHGYLLRCLKPFDATRYIQDWKEGRRFNPC